MSAVHRARTPRVLALAGALALAGCAGAEGAAPESGAVLTLAERGASSPTAAVDARTGRGYVAWVGRRDSVANVYLAAAEPGAGAFAPAVRVNDVPGDAAPHEQAPAQVAVGPEGNVYVVWPNATPVPGRRFPASDLRLAVSTDGGRTFAPAVTVNDGAGGVPTSHTFHDVAVAPDGALYVSWIDARVRDAARARRRAESAAGGAGHGAHGGEDGLPEPEIRVARSADGGRTFVPSVVVDGGSCPCCRTALAVAPDGSVYVAWRKRFAGDVRDVVVARSAPGALAFSAPVRAHADGWVFPGCPHAGPSLTVDGGGRVHVAWYTGRAGRQGLWHAVSADGARSFGPPSAVLTGGWVPPSLVRLAPAGGTVRAAWDDRRSREGEVTTFGEAASGGGVRATPGARVRGRTPSLASGADGAVLAAWLDGDAVRARWTGR